MNKTHHSRTAWHGIAALIAEHGTEQMALHHNHAPDEPSLPNPVPDPVTPANLPVR